MIRKLKKGETFKRYIHNTSEIIEFTCQFNGNFFINDKNFIHNDVGQAWHYRKPSGDWYWKGRWIK